MWPTSTVCGSALVGRQAAPRTFCAGVTPAVPRASRPCSVTARMAVARQTEGRFGKRPQSRAMALVRTVREPALSKLVCGLPQAALCPPSSPKGMNLISRRFHLISAKITYDTPQVEEPDCGPARRGQQRFHSSVAGHIPVSLAERWPVAPDAGRIGTHATDCLGRWDSSL